MIKMNKIYLAQLNEKINDIEALNRAILSKSDLVSNLENKNSNLKNEIKELKNSLKDNLLSESFDGLLKIFTEMDDKKFIKRINNFKDLMDRYYINSDKTRTYLSLNKSTSLEDRAKLFKKIVIKRMKDLNVKTLEISIKKIEEALYYSGKDVKLWMPRQVQDALRNVGFNLHKCKGYSLVKLSLIK